MIVGGASPRGTNLPVAALVFAVCCDSPVDHELLKRSAGSMSMKDVDGEAVDSSVWALLDLRDDVGKTRLGSDECIIDRGFGPSRRRDFA